MRYYRSLSLILAVVFGAVGILFLFFPDGVVNFFNIISSSIGMKTAPLPGFNFYLILSAAYMYVVTILAFMMYRHPENTIFPLLLANAKCASSVLSLLLFSFISSYLIYLVNSLVDGAIGIMVLVIYFKMKRGIA